MLSETGVSFHKRPCWIYRVNGVCVVHESFSFREKHIHDLQLRSQGFVFRVCRASDSTTRMHVISTPVPRLQRPHPPIAPPTYYVSSMSHDLILYTTCSVLNCYEWSRERNGFEGCCGSLGCVRCLFDGRPSTTSDLAWHG